jgi:hypothetical protein
MAMIRFSKGVSSRASRKLALAQSRCSQSPHGHIVRANRVGGNTAHPQSR